jgi:hypothetical protein
MLRLRHYCWLFALTASVSGIAYWLLADWYAYVKIGGEWHPKFAMPWWWQIVESGIVGVLAGGILVGAAHFICAISPCRRNRCRRQPD